MESVDISLDKFNKLHRTNIQKDCYMDLVALMIEEQQHSIYYISYSLEDVLESFSENESMPLVDIYCIVELGIYIAINK